MVHMLPHLVTHLLIQADQLHFLLPISLLETALERRVVVVFNVVVRSTRQVLSDFAPPITIDFMKLKDSLILLGCPFNLLNVWIKMIVPSKRQIETGALTLWHKLWVIRATVLSLQIR